MALTLCADCGKQISAKASACPHCGKPGIQVFPWLKLAGTLMSLAGAVLFWFVPFFAIPLLLCGIIVFVVGRLWN